MISVMQGVLGLASGALVGFSLGLVGGGGSILAVPLMVYVVGVPDPHVAIGTSAIAVAANAAVNLSNHARGGTVVWSCALMFAAGMSIMAAVSSSLVAVTAFGLTTAASYAWSGLISWWLASLFIAGGIAGGLLGTRFAGRLSARRGALNIVFAAAIIAVAL